MTETNDMSAVIIPRSDQLNAEDFLAGPKTFTIEAVQITPGTEQPVQIRLAGEPRVWRPCKSMSRVLVAAWGPDAKVYPGRSVTLYRDPKVKWGGLEVGGIRVSHMTHIDKDMMVSLTATKGKRSPHVVKPLAAEVKQIPADGARNWADGYVRKVEQAQTAAELEAFASDKATKLAELEAKRPELHAECVEALTAKRASLAEPGDAEPASDADDFDDDFDSE